MGPLDVGARRRQLLLSSSPPHFERSTISVRYSDSQRGRGWFLKVDRFATGLRLIVAFCPLRVPVRMPATCRNAETEGAASSDTVTDVAYGDICGMRDHLERLEA